MTAFRERIIKIIDDKITEAQRQGVNFFDSDRMADQIISAVEEIADNMGNEPMPRFGKSGKYIRSPQSFQDGFEEARSEVRRTIGRGK